MSMIADEKGAYTRCCNFLIEMLLKYGTNGEEDDNNLDANKKEGGEIFPTFLFALQCFYAII